MEEWRDIQGYENYQVSSLGRVKSLKRKVWNGKVFHDKQENLLKTTFNSVNYDVVNLVDTIGNKQTYYVHRLVAQTFIDNPHNKVTVNHINGNKRDNSIHNLEWNTMQENIKHAYNNDLINKNGECNHFSKMTEKDVLDMRKLSKFFNRKELSEIFNTNVVNVGYILKRKTWKHI